MIGDYVATFGGGALFIGLAFGFMRWDIRRPYGVTSWWTVGAVLVLLLAGIVMLSMGFGLLLFAPE